MLQHQMVHSPARLGLPNPNSPSLNQQNQQQQQPPTAATNTTPATTSVSSSKLLVANASASSSSSTPSSSTASNALLSLLPPLGRAQSLLAQMASLASRLFEVSPNRSLWLSSFRGTLPTFLSASASASGCGSSAKEILAQFTALQTQLFEAVAQLQEILDLQDSTAKLSREVRSRDSATLAFSRCLSDSERLLDSLLDDYSHYQKRFKPNPNHNVEEEEEEEEDEDEDEDVSSSAAAATTTVASRLQLPDILSYAHRISYTTFAPPEFGAGQAPLRGALPPAPQEEQMRASQLYAMANLDVGLPPIDAAGGFEPMMEPPPPPPMAAEAAVPDFGMLPPDITVPVGWKPGMPVELPINIPLPPPGWKPGDPVPLPPMPSLRDQPLRPKAAAETIQVRHVQLDILDQDDNSSDYSSDDASSDDDD